MPVIQHCVLTGISRKIKQIKKKNSKVLESITIISMICDSREVSACQCDFRPNFSSSCLRLPQLWNKNCIYSAWQGPENFVQLFPSPASQAARARACPQCDLLCPWDCSWWRISKWFSQRNSFYHHGRIKNSTLYSPAESKAEPGSKKKLSQPKPGHKPKFIDSLKSLFSFVSTSWVCRGWFISSISFHFRSNYPLHQPGQQRVRLHGQGMWRKDKPLDLQARSRRILVKSPSSALS